YAGDNRLISEKSSYRRGVLAPRCRLITSRGWRKSQGLDCSLIKVAREVDSERYDTVRSLSTVDVRNLSGSDSSTRGPNWINLWCISCAARCIAEELRWAGISAESI